MVGDPVAGPPAGIGTGIAARVVGWYRTHGRRLVIRELRDPYAIWLAEAMSQQTQIGRVGTALPAFLERFPTPSALAEASTDALLRAWGDLGYPRRALALRAAARAIVADHGGRVPGTVVELEALPGVGPYTARAVAATAYGVAVTALDVNARRVLARVLGVSPGQTLTRAFAAHADGLAPARDAAAWNHGLMDLGATVCRQRPDHARCPLRDVCLFAQHEPGDAPHAEPPERGSPVPRPPFRETNRYVRGRVLGLLRDGPPGAWTTVRQDTLDINQARLARALSELAKDGLIELDAQGRARLPIDPAS